MFYGTNHPNFEQEVKILAGLSHPNIMPLLGYAMDENKCSIIMELMDGDLFSLMQERLHESHTSKVPFTIFEAVDKMLQTAEGMLYLHEKRIVHRDLKSQNILIKKRQEIHNEYIYVKVADFGLAKTKESSSSCSNLTLNTGTTRWMAPELMTLGNDDLHARPSNSDTNLKYPFKVDIYSFGMVCFEILTGQVPFSNIIFPKEVKKKVLDGDRAELPNQCPDTLKTLISSCWEHEPSRRPSFVEICQRLRIVKFLFMRGQEPIEENFCQIASLIITSRIASYGMEPISLFGRNFFRASIGGISFVVAKFENQWEHSEEQSFNDQVLRVMKLDHQNVLKIIGCQLDEQSKVVVYDLAASRNEGSLDEMLHGTAPVLTWRQRVKIAVGVARGLEFLHNQNPPIICGTVQSSKILMFADDVAKIGAITIKPRRSTLRPGDIRHPLVLPSFASGMDVFIDNDYSTQRDIFDFGVLILELLTGKPIKCSEFASIQKMLSEDKVHNNFDMRLISPNYPAKDAAKMAAVARICCQDEPDFRPNPGLVLKALEQLLSNKRYQMAQ